MPPSTSRHAAPAGRADERLAWLLITPALATIVLVSLVPIAATFWDALHRHDLRLPWLGRPFIGFDNFVEAARDPRFGAALAHTIGFGLVSVPIELALGVILALILQAPIRGRGLLRATALLPWAVPTVVGALVWRFMFDARAGILAEAARTAGVSDASFDWFVDPLLAWVPIVLADVWKTAPFVAILVLAGLQTIDPAIHEAARMDGAGPVRRFTSITLPLLWPTLIVAGAFRFLDALRVFDLVYVLTGGGPGTVTEPLSMYAFVALTQRLRFGYGSALSMSVFLLTLAFALLAAVILGRSQREEAR
jgi:ABC-type sugar transport system permease subunit